MQLLTSLACFTNQNREITRPRVEFCAACFGEEQTGARRGHSLQSCEKSLERGKVKVGEEPTAGAELMLLDTTEDAGTWRARKSAPGLVGSSVGGWRQRWRRGEKKEKEIRRRC